MVSFNVFQSLAIFLIEQIQIVIVLSIVVVFFLIVLILGVRKSYKLKKENERLDKISEDLIRDKKDKYSDFTDGHMYQ